MNTTEIFKDIIDTVTRPVELTEAPYMQTAEIGFWISRDENGEIVDVWRHEPKWIPDSAIFVGKMTDEALVEQAVEEFGLDVRARSKKQYRLTVTVQEVQ